MQAIEPAEEVADNEELEDNAVVKDNDVVGDSEDVEDNEEVEHNEEAKGSEEDTGKHAGRTVPSSVTMDRPHSTIWVKKHSNNEVGPPAYMHAAQ